MNSQPIASRDSRHYELRFRALFDARMIHRFACDAAGHVDLDGLGDSARRDYLYMRTLIGRDFSMPAVHVSEAD